MKKIAKRLIAIICVFAQVLLLVNGFAPIEAFASDVEMQEESIEIPDDGVEELTPNADNEEQAEPHIEEDNIKEETNVSDEGEDVERNELTLDIEDAYNEENIQPSEEPIDEEDAFISSFSLEEEEETRELPEVNLADWESTTSSKNEVTLTKYNGTNPEVLVPSQINGNPVTKINTRVLSNKDITKLYIPTSITSMYQALIDDNSITEVEFLEGEGRTQIPDSALYKALAIERVIIPEGVTTIGRGAFQNASKLCDVILPESLKTIDENAFQSCTSLFSIVFPSLLNSLGRRSFKNTGIERIEIPTSVTQMSYPFMEDTTIKEVVFKEGTTKIPNHALYSASGVDKVFIPEGVTEIGDSAFYDTASLKEIILPSTLTTIGSSAFNKAGIEEIVIPDTVSSIGTNIASNDVKIIAQNLYSFTTIHGFWYNINTSYETAVRKDNHYLTAGNNEFTSARSDNSTRITLDLIYNAKEVDNKNSKLALLFGESYYLSNVNVLLDGKIVDYTSYTTGSVDSILIPIKKASGRVSISVGCDTSLENTDLRCMAMYFNKKTENMMTGTSYLKNAEVIGVLDEGVPMVTAGGSYDDDSNTIKIWGSTKPGTKLTLYDGETDISGTYPINPRFDGMFETTISSAKSLFGSRDRANLKIVGEIDGKSTDAEFVVFKKKTPVIKQFDFYSQTDKKFSKIDLLSGDKFYYTSLGKYPYYIEIELDGGGPDISVYVVATNTRQGEKTLKAHWDASTGKYYAKGWFGDDKMFACKKIGIRIVYNDTKEAVKSYFDSDEYKAEEAKLFPNKTTTTTKNENNGSITAEIKYNSQNKASSTYYQRQEKYKSEIIEQAKAMGMDPEKSYKYTTQVISGRTYYTFKGISNSGNKAFVYRLGSGSSNSSSGPGSFGDTSSATATLQEFLGASNDDTFPADGIDMTFGAMKAFESELQKFGQNAFILKGYLIGLTSILSEAKNQLIDSFLKDLDDATSIAQDALSEMSDALSELIEEYQSIASIKEESNDLLNEFDMIILQGGSALEILIKALIAHVDPSGIVYEAVESNPIEGVEAKVYYADENKYTGEPNENTPAILWDAAAVEQVNPQTTGSDGAYAWDVPEGYWKVKVTKTGYEPAETAWLPVPPPQLGINIPLVSKEKPVIKEIYANENGLTVKFSKYVNKSDITNSSVIIKDASGSDISFDSIEYNTASDEMYADTITFKKDLNTYSKQTLKATFSESIKSYAGTPIDNQTLDVVVLRTPEMSISSDSLAMCIGEERQVTVNIRGDVADDSKIICSSDAGEIIEFSDNTKIENGKAIVKIKSNGYYEGNVYFRLENAELTKSCSIKNVISKTQATLSCNANLTKVSDGNAVENPNVTTTSNGEVVYEYYAKDNQITALASNPSDVGEYVLVIRQLASDTYYAATSLSLEFSINAPAANEPDDGNDNAPGNDAGNNNGTDNSENDSGIDSGAGNNGNSSGTGNTNTNSGNSSGTGNTNINNGNNSNATNGNVNSSTNNTGDNKATISAPKTIKLSKTSFEYDKKEKKPTVVVIAENGDTISSSNYDVSYSAGRKNVGKYTVTVRFKGDYSGTKTLSYVITPPKSSLGKISAGKKSFTAKWAKKTDQVSGYELQYSTSSSFKSGNKTVNIKSAKTVSKKINKLKGKKKYYVRIRTYKKVKGVKYISDWSKAKKVTTKQ